MMALLLLWGGRVGRDEVFTACLLAVLGRVVVVVVSCGWEGEG
jgi:hypothetical protein